MKKSFASIVLSIALSVSTFGNTPPNNSEDIDLPISSIVDKYYPAGSFYFGASSKRMYFVNPDEKADQFFTEFSYNTPENAFKQVVVYQQPDSKWNSAEYLYFIKKARENKQLIRCHGPISPQCSRWIMADERTPEELDKMIDDYFTKICKEMEANKDVVKWLDVVNEVFSGSQQKGLGYDGKETEDVVVYKADDWFGPKKGDKEWQNPYTILGFEHVQFNGEDLEIPKYVLKAFKIANKYAPSVKLIWNDHGKTTNPKIIEKLKKIVLYLRSTGLRIDGIGWQAHVNIGWEKSIDNIKNLESEIDWCYQNKLEFHITELDVTLQENNVAKSDQAEVFKKSHEEQANTFGAITETVLKKLGKGAVSINLWTMYDHAEGNRLFAGLFDENGIPNPSYYRVKEVLLKYGTIK